jgi:tetratricopeptide (TPR) repeat protein
MDGIRINIRVCVFIILLLPLLVPVQMFTSYAQTDDCAGNLARAEKEYQAGNFAEAVNLIKPCLKSNELTEAEKGNAYRLLGLVYIAEELEKDANEAVRNLLLMVPKYKVDMEKDPPQLQRIIEDVSQNLQPEIYKITPDNVYSGIEKIIVKISGKNFVNGSSVRFNNIDRGTNYINAGELEVELTSADLGGEGEYYVNVYSPILDGKSSNSVKFNVISQRAKFSIHGILPIPIGDFAADKGNEGDGFASIGYGAFAELNYPLNTSGLGWISSVAFLYNGNSSDFNATLLKSLGFEVTKEVGSYTTIPIMSGLSYTGEMSPGLNFILAGQLSFAFISVGNETDKITGYTEDGDMLSGEIKDEYKSATSIGFGLGGGLIINNLIIISAKYLNLGKPELKYDETVTLSYLDITDSISYSDSRNQSISYFTLSIGIAF